MMHIFQVAVTWTITDYLFHFVLIKNHAVNKS